MTLIVDCLVNKGILIGTDCKRVDKKFEKPTKVQKIYPFQSKDKITIMGRNSYLCNLVIDKRLIRE